MGPASLTAHQAEAAAVLPQSRSAIRATDSRTAFAPFVTLTSSCLPHALRRLLPRAGEQGKLGERLQGACHAIVAP